jgi:hypothetical protein
MGSDKILIKGLTSELNKPRSSPAVKATITLSSVASPAILIKGKKYAASVIEKVSITQFISHFNK